MNSDTLTISTSLPVSVNPSRSEIVFNPETNSYALSVGVTVQLPISDLVEVLLKFNQEQVRADPIAQPETRQPRGRLASLPDPTRFSPNRAADSSEGVYTPKAMPTVHAADSSSNETSASSHAFDDDFMRIPVAITRQDPFLMDYRERSKWRRPSGKFFVDCAVGREEKRVEKLSFGFKCYDELPVHQHFLDAAAGLGFDDEFVGREYRSGSMDSGASVKPFKGKLSADAPVFTPGSAFASTHASDSDSIRQRASSEVEEGGRAERAMSLSLLPPSALSVMEEEPLKMSVAESKSAFQSFWGRVTKDTADEPPALARAESRPAECKQM